MFIAYIIIISILLESITSNIIPMNSMFNGLFTLTSLIIIYPYFNNDDKSFLKYSAIIGLSYDIIFTDTLFLNMIIFLLMALLIKKINMTLSNNYINVMIITLIVVTSYLTLTYLLLYLIGYKQFNLTYLYKIIFQSYISNVLYSCILYIITDKISKKHKISKID